MPLRRSNTSAATVGVRRRRNTAYDDCVIFPFTVDGGDDYKTEGLYYGGGNVNAASGFQQEEYGTERSLWRENREHVNKVKLIPYIFGY